MNNKLLPSLPGETLGHGYPDWPEDLTTFAERIAYQRGVADARAVHAILATTDDYKAWYEEAMVASNEAGYVGMDAAQTIRALAADLAAARDHNP